MVKQPVTPPYHIYYPVKVAKSKIAGKGAYALQRIPARKKIGDLGGVIITMKEAMRLIKNLKVINLVELDNNLALNASANPNDMRFINHSCGPNTYLRANSLANAGQKTAAALSDLVCNQYRYSFRQNLLSSRFIAI